MRKILLLLVLNAITGFCASAQEATVEGSIVELARIYKKFCYRNAPSSETYTQLKALKNPQLKASVEFIRQAVTENNNLNSKNFLACPDTATLKYLHAIRETSIRLGEEDSDNLEIARQAVNSNPSVFEMVDAYYYMLFSSLLYKNGSFNWSKVNFQLDKYRLPDEGQKGIFVLQLVNACSKALGEMVSADSVNHEQVYNAIQKFPKINGQAYFKYTDFNFPDFEKTIVQEPQSYKSYYLDRYYTLLLRHLDCIENCTTLPNAAKEKEELIMTSILNEGAYYKYSQDAQALKKINPILSGH
jgi:hypothetical protein